MALAHAGGHSRPLQVDLALLRWQSRGVTDTYLLPGQLVSHEPQMVSELRSRTRS